MKGDLLPFGSLNVSNLNISGGLSIALWAIFAVAMALFVGASFVLLYHWRTYGLSNRQVITAEIVYLSVSAIIIALAVMCITLV